LEYKVKNSINLKINILKKICYSIKKIFTVGVTFLSVISLQLQASKLVEVKIVDKDYIQIYFKDGDCVFVDDGLGPKAYTSEHQTDNNSIVLYGAALNTTNAVTITNWKLTSTDDANYGTTGVAPDFVYRKSKLNGMAELDWGSNDWIYEYSMDHTIFLKLPSSLIQGSTYTLEINSNTNSDITSETFTYDIFNCQSEAIHVNLSGYMATPSIKAADLYIWMGDGGARDYSDFEGNNVYIYDVNNQTSQQVGTLTFWKSNASEAQGYNFTRSDVWNADFTGFDTPGTYRLAIDGVGCSADFIVDNEAYRNPFMVNTQGYYYMRIGEDRLDMEPVPRRPLYIPGVSPANTTVYITTMEYTHPNWGSLVGGDVWDAPNAWAPYSTGRTNPNAYGGHSDALDWDRHLSHVSNIYDLLLPYILSYGALSDDDLDIGESGNGIPDVLDEARNEVDFWLRLRDGMGYSCGLTNPNSNNVLYQAGTNAIAAWANALNSSMLAECYRIAGQPDLMNTYLDSAIVAYNYAGSLPNQMLDFGLDEGNGITRGRDLKMAAAAYLYNLTGDTNYEDVVNIECVVAGTTSTVIDLNSYNQLYAIAGYLKTNQTVNYPTLFDNMKASIINEAKNREANYTNSRPSRRATDNSLGYFHTAQNVHRTLLAHSVATTQNDLSFLENALILEADWGLGRNPSNLIQMTTATTPLESKRSIEAAYTSGFDDGSVGQHPGHTPYMNMDNWGSGMITGRPSWLGDKCYPAVSSWPKAETWFNTRYVWAHSEFTPQQTMRGKQALYGYLYALGKGFAVTPANGVVVTPTTASIIGSGTAQLTATVSPSNATYKAVIWSTSDSLIAKVSSSGLVTGGISSGTTTITATTVVGGFSSSCQITVSSVSVNSLSVNPPSASINVNNTQQLTAIITPSNASDKIVAWSSNNASVATVSPNGLVSGIAQGNATITATSNDGGKTASCNVTVNYISVTNVSIYTQSTEMYSGETQQLSAIFTPSNASNQNVSWSSSNESVATVSSSGLLTANNSGSTTITVTTQDGGLTDTVAITIEISSDIIIYRDSNDLITGWWDQNGTLTRQTSGGSEGVKCLLFDYSLNNWWSGLGFWFPSVDVSILENLVIDFKGPTTSGAYTYIYLGDAHGNTSETYDVTRSSSYETVTISLDQLIGDSDIDLTQINEIGVNISGVSSGSGTLYFDNIYFDNGIDTPVSGVTLDLNNFTINGTNTQQLVATVLPTNASNLNTTWRSSNTSVATVNALGLVTGVSPGTALITVTTVDGGFTANCTVTVNNVALQGITVSPSNVEINSIEGLQLTVSFNPSNSINKIVSWSSSNTSVATVNPNGFIQGISEGSATITATSQEGGFTSTCQVNVIEAPQEIVIYRDQGGIVDFVWDGNGTLTELSSGGQEGSEHYRYNYVLSNWWDGIGFNFPAQNVSQYENLILAINGPSSASNNIVVSMSDADEVFVDYTVSRTTEYTLIEIPLSDFEGSNDLTTINHIMISVSGTQTGTGTFYIDNIYFGGTIPIVPVAGITVDPSSGTIDGGTIQLLATLIPTNATNKDIAWSSSNPAVASVNLYGTVMGNSIGSATITATTVDGDFAATCSINVINPTQGRVLKIMPLGNSITEGYTIPGAYRLKFWQNLEEAGLHCGVDIVGTLNNNSVNGLDDPDHEGHSGWTTGQILAQIDNYMAAETPDIVMMHLGTNDLAQNVTDQAPANLRGLIDHICAALPIDGKLYVSKIIPIGGMGNAASLAYNNMIEDAVTEKQALDLPVFLVDAYSIWSNDYISSDWTHPNQTGYNVLGDFWFNVIKNDIQLPCVTTIPVTGVSLNASSTTINVDSTIQLYATIIPSNATNKNITWSTSDDAIASVSLNGLVTGIALGRANITVSTVDGNFSAVVSIEVNAITDTLMIDNVTLNDDDVECYNAYHAIIVAANNEVIIETGASAEYIAGKSIVFMPGFHAQNGAYINARITSDSSFCSSSSMHSYVYEHGRNKSFDDKFAILNQEETDLKNLKVYPNPNPGSFFVELQHFEDAVPVIFYNSLGMAIYKNIFIPGIINEINIPYLHSGIYFIKAYSKDEQLVRKIIVIK
jgi:endoglucanase